MPKSRCLAFMCRTGSTERSRRQPVAEDTVRRNTGSRQREERQKQEGSQRCKDCAARPVAIAPARICMAEGYVRRMRPMRAKGPRKRKPFVAVVPTGEAESRGESEQAADAVPSFVG